MAHRRLLTHVTGPFMLALVLLVVLGSTPLAAQSALQTGFASASGPAALSVGPDQGSSMERTDADVTPTWQIGGTTKAVVTQGNVAYVGVGPRLVVVDITTPDHAVPVGLSPALSGLIEGLAVAGNFAYVAAGDNGLYIINVANPANPTVVGSYDSPGYSHAVAVLGTRAYLVDMPRTAGSFWVPGALRIIDVSNPAQPVQLGIFESPWSPSGIAVAGNYAYVADSPVWSGGELVGGGLRIIDVTNPTSPTQVGFYSTSGSARSVALVGNLAYIADGQRNSGSFWVPGSLRIVDVSDPANPVARGMVETAGDARAVAVVGTRAYVANGDNGLKIEDVANPASPSEVGAYDTPGYANGVAVHGNYAYVADRDWGVWVLSLTGSAAPRVTQISSFYVDVTASVNGTPVSLGRAVQLQNVQINGWLPLPSGTAPSSGSVAGTTYNASLTLAATSFDPLAIALQRYQVHLASGQLADLSNIGTITAAVPGTTSFTKSVTQTISGIGNVTFTFTGQIQTTVP